MSKSEFIKEAVKASLQMPRSDLQAWIEAEVMKDPSLGSSDEILRTVDEMLLHTI